MWGRLNCFCCLIAYPPRHQEYWDAVRAEGKKDAKNHSKVAYNITTLEYNSDEKGKVQKYVDDMGE